MYRFHLSYRTDSAISREMTKSKLSFTKGSPFLKSQDWKEQLDGMMDVGYMGETSKPMNVELGYWVAIS
jgi:hypothetical protein